MARGHWIGMAAVVAAAAWAPPARGGGEAQPGPPAGRADWPEFDPQVFGGNYTNHYGNKLTATIRIAEGAGEGVAQGIAIYASANAGPSTGGHWEYMVDTGSWTPFGTVADTAALLLKTAQAQGATLVIATHDARVAAMLEPEFSPTNRLHRLQFHDAGEPGLEGVPVQRLKDDVLYGIAHTNVDGFYQYGNSRRNWRHRPARIGTETRSRATASGPSRSRR